MRMMMTAIVLAAMATPAVAWDDMKRMSVAQSLGDVMASEEVCGLAYDHDKVAAYVEKTVPATDMEFTSMLNLMTMGAKAQTDDMSASSKAAHCAQIRRVAKSYGFTG